ncbi:MAG TPA: STAS domain-containing protein [Ilumatobacteraceae bacterium]|nr:STAS domain-containing protein [Ilumatobacteraceae bacterium]
MAAIDDESFVNATAEVHFGDEGSVVIRVTGEIDIATADIIRQAVAVATEPRPARLVFDLLAVDFIDSSGLAVLLEAAKTADSVRIDPASNIVRRVIEATGLSEMFGMGI